MLAFDKRPPWLRLVFSVRGSELPRIRNRLIAVGAMSVLLTFAQEYEHIQMPLSLSSLSLMGLALGIFLGFRNNTSYDRFWEGRKQWGQLINTARTLSRDLLSFGPNSSAAGPFERAQIHRVIAFVHALRLHLRDQMKPSELAAYLSEEELEAVTGELNVPNAILTRIARANQARAAEGQLSDYRFVRLAEHLTTLSDVQGGCERIKSTPIPHSYTILLHRIVAMYVFALPFGLVKSLHLATPVVVLMVAYTFLGLDAVGDELEDPFGEDPNDLPLSTLSRMVEVNLRQMLGETEVPPLLAPVNGQSF